MVDEVIDELIEAKKAFRTVVGLLLRHCPEYEHWINKHFEELLKDEDNL